jgi:hypothetical protein
MGRFAKQLSALLVVVLLLETVVSRYDSRLITINKSHMLESVLYLHIYFAFPECLQFEVGCSLARERSSICCSRRRELFWRGNVMSPVGSVGCASVCSAGGRGSIPSRTNTRGLKISEEKVLPLQSSL